MNSNGIIHDRGRGPEIKGTRITVFALFNLVEQGWTAERLAELFALEVTQVEAAILYIRDNYAAVKSEYEVIEARHARGNPPHIKALLEESHKRFLSRLNDAQRQRIEEIYRERTAG